MCSAPISDGCISRSKGGRLTSSWKESRTSARMLIVNDAVLEAASKAAPIEFLTERRTIDFPNEWYEANSEDHFWFQWRARAAESLIDRLGLATGPPLRVFDVGCGTGITCKQLSRVTNWIFEGADLNIEALSRCDPCLSRLLYYDILERRSEFRERYDVIV